MRRILLTILATALLAAPAAAQLQQGLAAYEQGRYDEAKRLLTPLANDAEALATLGQIALIEDDAERAAQLFEKAIAKSPRNAKNHFHLGEAYGSLAQSAGILKQASLAKKTKAAFEKAVELDPNFIDARFGLIDYYMIAPGFMGGSHEKALEQAAEIKKRDRYQGHRAFARVYIRQKKNDLARKEYVEMVREEPNAARTHTTFGTFLAVTDKNYKSGFEEIEKAIVLDPNYMPAYVRLGQVAAMSGQNLARGEEVLKKYLTYKPKENELDHANTHFFLGMIYEKMGKKGEAKASYSAALKLAPKSKAVQEALKRVS